MFNTKFKVELINISLMATFQSPMDFFFSQHKPSNLFGAFNDVFP